MAWFDRGLRFECAGCGRCCTQGPGYVWVTPSEVEALARRTGLGIESFGRRYLMRVGRRLSLIERGGDYRCVFLDPENRCSVYDVRPRQCRTFPFWPENLGGREDWEEVREYCEGLDKGRRFSAREIREIRDRAGQAWCEAASRTARKASSTRARPSASSGRAP